MMTECPEVIESDNLSHAWGRVFLRLMDSGSRSRRPILLSIRGFRSGRAVEDEDVRRLLDAELAAHGKYACAESALTIFPHKHWVRHRDQPAAALFRWYLEQYLPRLRGRNRLNRIGTYFERMIRFHGAKRVRGNLECRPTNQLDHILRIWRRDSAKGSRPRQSALQVACFDPAKDHTGQKLRGFPCLQQVSFGYDDNRGLAMTAFYPTQYVFDRGYGNYLGLAHLGEFVSHEMGLELARLNCLILHPELGRGMTKAKLRALADAVRQRVAPAFDEARH